MLAGCGTWFAGPGGVQIWAAPDSTVLLSNTPAELENEVFSNTTRTIRLEAAVNETVSFQLGFRGQLGQAAVTSIRIDDFTQQDRSIPSSANVRMYREDRLPVQDYPAWYLRLTPNLREAREFPDILVPLTAPRGGLPIQVREGTCEAVWADLTIPPGTESGIYRSTVDVALRSGSRSRLEVMLTVHPFSLPLTQHLAVVTGIDAGQLMRHHLEVGGRPYAPKRLSADDPAYAQATKLIDGTIRLLHEHRCSAMVTDVQPLRQLDSGGRLQLDWTDYDRLVSSILDGTGFEDRVPALAWPMPIDDHEPDPELYGGWASAAYGQMLTDYLRQCAQHFRERGWFDRHFVWIPLPTSGLAASPYSQVAWLGSTIRRADNNMSLVCSLPPQSMKPFGGVDDKYQDLAQWVGIWAPPASMADRDTLDAQKGAGRRVWLQPDRPPYSGSLSFIAPADHAQSLAWQAYRFGCDAIFLPRVTEWPPDGAAGADTPAGGRLLPGEAASAHMLLWPGKPYGLTLPVPSIRLKRILRGVQDFEYLWLLEHNQRPAVADLMAADLFAFGGTGCYGEHMLDSRPNGWVHNASAWLLARSLMARELTVAIEQADRQPSTQPTGANASFLDFAHQIDWRRHVEGVRRVNTYVEGVRVRLEPKKTDRPVAVNATVVTFNATREPYSGALSIPELPKDWQIGHDPAPIENLRPTRTTIREIETFTASIPTNIDGVLNLQLRALPEHGDPTDLPARLCVLTAHKFSQPVVLDGKLTEWPLATNNAAGDFVLVGALDVPKVGRPNPDRPSQQTIVFVGHDAENLYVAFNCQDDRLDSRIVTQSNRVSYDDLWPTGEDVLEVVLDPAGDAVVPQDLYHVAVKANGAVITERGAPCLARVGGHGDWPGFVTAAVDDKSQPGRWMVEIRIPLANIGKLAPVWGINFARYNARLGEYSTWSGARRYLYSPASLGNIQLAP
jgi:hypothetical protein